MNRALEIPERMDALNRKITYAAEVSLLVEVVDYVVLIPLLIQGASHSARTTHRGQFIL